MSYPNLNLLLQAANRRQLFLGLARAGFLALSALVLGLLVAVVLDAILAFPVWALFLLDAVLVALIMSGLIMLFRVVRQGRFDARRLARLLEQRLGMDDNALINAIDLRVPQNVAVSRRLAEASVQRGEAVARHVDLRKAVVGRPAQRAAVSVALALAGTGLAYLIMPGVFARGLPRLLDPTGNHPAFTLVRFAVDVQPDPLPYGASATITAQLTGPALPDRADVVFRDRHEEQRLPMIETDQGYRLDLQHCEQPREFYIDTPKGRSDWYRMDVQQVPMFEEVWVSYLYPAHTDWAPRRHRLAGRDIEALVGTRVAIEAGSNFPLAAANLEIFAVDSAGAAPAKISLLPAGDDPRRVRGEFLLRHSGRLTLQLVGHNQLPGPEVREARLIALVDRPPQVAIVDPEPMALAVEDWKVPVAVEAADDIQVTGLQLRYQRKDESLQVLPLEMETADRRHVRGIGEFDLAKLGARPGDEIRLFASAQDNDPQGAQTGDSPSHVIQVISQEQYMDYLRASYQMEQLSEEIAQLNERLEQLAQQRQEALQQAQTLQQQLESGQSPDEQQREQLQQTLNQYSQQLQDLSEQLRERLETPQLYDAERAYRQQLQQLADQLGQQQGHSAQLQQSLESLTPGASPQREDLQRLEQALQQMQQQSEPFSDRTAEALTASQRHAEQLAQAQQMMSEAQRIQQVMQQQRQLADRLQTLTDQAPSSPADQRRADQLAREQEQLNQQLQEAKQHLNEVAERAAESLPQTSRDASQLCNSIDQQGIPSDQQQAARAARHGAPAQAVQAAQRAADKLEALADHGPRPQGAGQEMGEGSPDRGLRLSADDIQRTLQQLARGQAMPSLGQRARDQGNRSSDALSRFGLHGPQPPREAFSGRRSRPTHDARGGEGEASAEADFAKAESIEATSRTFELGAAGNMRGVPVGYRDQAEAYFRRLAEELSSEAEHDAK